MYDIYTPRARHWAVPALVSGVVAVFAFSAPEPTVWVWILSVVCAVFGGWALVNFAHHVAHALIDLRREDRELSYRLSQNFTLEQIGRMNDAQLAAVRVGRHTIEVIPSEGGPVEKLWGANAYLPLTWYILVNSTEKNVYPIRNFQAETYIWDSIGDHKLDDLQHARNVHSWLCMLGYAKEAVGNQSAVWVKPHTPDKVLKMLGMDRETYIEKEDS